MKKLIILLSLIALLASGMAFAQEKKFEPSVTFNGYIEYEAATSLKTGAAWTNAVGTSNALTVLQNERYSYFEPDARIIVTIKPDEYNTGVFRIRTSGAYGQSAGSLTGDEAIRYDRAFFVSDFGKAFKLPIGWQGRFGYNEYNPAYISNLGWDLTKKVIGRFALANDYYFDAKYWGTEQVITIENMVRIATFFSLQNSRLKDMYVDGVVTIPAGPGSLGIEAAYLVWSNASLNGGLTIDNSNKLQKASTPTINLDEGTMLFGLAYKGVKAGDIGLDFGGAYYLPLEEKKAYAVYAANVKASFGSLASFLVGFQGVPENKDLNIKAQALHNVRIAAGFTPVPVVSFDVGVILYTGGEEVNFEGKDREMFNTLDVSACVKAGKASFRLGYLFVAEKDISIDPYMTDALKKSLYFLANMPF